MTSAVSIRDMSFAWPKSSISVLQTISMEIPGSSRCIIAGLNGAGKSSLLRTICGLYKYDGSINVMGKEAFRPNFLGASTTTEIVSGTNVWRNNDCVLVAERWQPSGDSKVSTMIDFVEGSVPDRIDMLVERFGIDMNWRVNQLSDGRKRRVQLLIAFARPSNVMLLDEVTTDLDILARQTLLEFLREESEQRGVTVLFSTHIFDGLEDWSSHLALLSTGGAAGAGATLAPGLAASPLDSIADLRSRREAREPAPLFSFVHSTLRADRDAADAAADERGGGGPRGRRERVAAMLGGVGLVRPAKAGAARGGAVECLSEAAAARRGGEAAACMVVG